MSLPFRRDIAVIVSLLFLYWGLSFATEYFLNEHPLSAEAWQKMRLQILLVCQYADNDTGLGPLVREQLWCARPYLTGPVLSVIPYHSADGTAVPCPVSFPVSAGSESG